MTSWTASVAWLRLRAAQGIITICRSGTVEASCQRRSASVTTSHVIARRDVTSVDLLQFTPFTTTISQTGSEEARVKFQGYPLPCSFTRNFWFSPIYETRLTWVNGGFHSHHTNADQNRHQHEPIRILHDLKQNKHPVQFPFHLICVQSDVIHSMRNNSL